MNNRKRVSIIKGNVGNFSLTRSRPSLAFSTCACTHFCSADNSHSNSDRCASPTHY